MTKQQEEEVLKAYSHYWDSYISGNIVAMATVMHEDIHVFGSTLHEVFTDKQSAIAYYRATADQISNKVEFRNKKIDVQSIDGNIMVLEQLDLYLLIDAEWTFYGHGRLSTLLINTNGGWQVIHQHGSLPDGKAEEGQQVAAEKIKEENLQLKEAIKRRTVELENKNRELEIEGALEMVRARAMAMQNSNELAALVETVFKELTKLHFIFDRCIIMIYDEKTNASTWWMANPEPGSQPVGIYVQDHKHSPYRAYIQAWKNQTIKWEYLLQGKEKKDWDSFIFNETDMSLLPQPISKGMRSLESVYLNGSFNHFGSLTVSSLKPLPHENFAILLRFAKVFDLTYTRFNDLQKAEAQTREAEIELALERVRARTMASSTVMNCQKLQLYYLNKYLIWGLMLL